jgi:toxin YoeB
MESPYEGIGKPEQLVGILEGHWSRRISGKDRLVYFLDGSELVITQLRHHY